MSSSSRQAFLALQSAWGINLGIGVDVHVHRLSNRLGWCKTKDPEGTRLVLQSWLPKEVSRDGAAPSIPPRY